MRNRGERDNRAILSIVLAIIGIVWGFMFTFGPVAAIVLGVIGFYLGFRSRRDTGMNASNFGGMIFGIISVVLGIVTMLYNFRYVV